MEYDVRDVFNENFSAIRFARAITYRGAEKLTTKGDGVVEIEACDLVMIIESKEDAENMIRAIQKAIDIGWFDK